MIQSARAGEILLEMPNSKTGPKRKLGNTVLPNTPSLKDMGIERMEAHRWQTRPAAKQRQKEHGGTAPGKKKNTAGKLPEVIKGDSRDAVGAAVGMSTRKTNESASDEGRNP